MLIALSQSPITAQQFFDWNEKFKDEILVEVIDIDTNYMEDETTGPSPKQKNSGELDKDSHLVKKMMTLILLLPQWKLKLNLKF